MKYVERKPAVALRKFIECFWLVTDEPGGVRKAERIIPDGCPEWIVHVGDPFRRRVGRRWVRQPKSFLAGTLTRPWLIQAGSKVCTLGIRFRPGAAAILLEVDLSGTADAELSLSRLSIDGAKLVDAVCAQSTPQRLLRRAERELLSLIGSRIRRTPETGKAVDLVRATRGRARIDALAKSAGVSRRTLERLFRRELGISPKQYARIIRLNAALELIAFEDRARIVDIALDAGYFDEPHLLNEFRSLAGRKPRGHRDSDGDLARYFTRPDRLRTLLLG